MAETCCSGLTYFDSWLSPEEWARQKFFSNTFNKYPLFSRVTYVSVSTCAGIAKVILLPLITLVGAIALPFMAAIQKGRGKEGAGGLLLAGCFSCLSLVATITFFQVSAYYLPLNVSTGIGIIAVVISISIHVHRAIKAPKP